MKKTKKTLAILLAAMMGLTIIAGCGSKDKPSEKVKEVKEESKEDNKEPVKLIVATTCMTKPYSFYDDNNEPAGSEIELWKEISERTGYEIEFTVADFAGITAAVDSKVADVASNCLGYTEQRAEKYKLSDPYLYQGMYLTVREDDDSINGIADLNGKKVACGEESLTKAVIDDYAKKNNIQVDYLFAETGTYMMEVNLGRADALVSQKVNFIQKMKTGEFQLKQVGEPLYEEQAVFLFRKDMNDEVVNNVNKAVKDMREDGTLSKIYNEWLEVDLSVSQL